MVRNLFRFQSNGIMQICCLYWTETDRTQTTEAHSEHRSYKRMHSRNDFHLVQGLEEGWREGEQKEGTLKHKDYENNTWNAFLRSVWVCWSPKEVKSKKDSQLCKNAYTHNGECAFMLYPSTENKQKVMTKHRTVSRPGDSVWVTQVFC